MAYNVSKHESTAHSPYFFMHGREAICPLDLLVGTPVSNAPEDLNQQAYAEELVLRLKKAFQEVGKHSEGKVERLKRDYDANVNMKSFNLWTWCITTTPEDIKDAVPRGASFTQDLIELRKCSTM